MDVWESLPVRDDEEGLRRPDRLLSTDGQETALYVGVPALRKLEPQSRRDQLQGSR